MWNYQIALKFPRDWKTLILKLITLSWDRKGNGFYCLMDLDSTTKSNHSSPYKYRWLGWKLLNVVNFSVRDISAFMKVWISSLWPILLTQFSKFRITNSNQTLNNFRFYNMIVFLVSTAGWHAGFPPPSTAVTTPSGQRSARTRAQQAVLQGTKWVIHTL